MSLVDKIGEKTLELLLNKKFLALFTVSLLLIVGFIKIGGVLNAETETERHIYNVNEYYGRGVESGIKGRTAYEEGDFDRADSLFKQKIALDKLALEEAEAAVDSAEDENERRAALHLKKLVEYSLLSDEKLLEMVQYKRNGDVKAAEISKLEGGNYTILALQESYKAIGVLDPYIEHMLEANNYFTFESIEVMKKGFEAFNERDFVEAERAFREVSKFNELALKEVQLAIEIAEDSKRKAAAEKVKEGLEFNLLFSNKMAESAVHMQKGENKAGRNSMLEALEYSEKAKKSIYEALKTEEDLDFFGKIYPGWGEPAEL